MTKFVSIGLKIQIKSVRKVANFLWQIIYLTENHWNFEQTAMKIETKNYV